jgi:hypothetical protein
MPSATTSYVERKPDVNPQDERWHVWHEDIHVYIRMYLSDLFLQHGACACSLSLANEMLLARSEPDEPPPCDAAASATVLARV